MIQKKYFGLVQSIIMSIIMGLVMSGIVTAINTGFDGAYLKRWMNAFTIVVPIAFICMQLLMPFAKKITTLLVDTRKESNM